MTLDEPVRLLLGQRRRERREFCFRDLHLDNPSTGRPLF